jgi:hypothetical protein
VRGFLKRGSRVVEIQYKNWPNNDYSHLASKLGLGYVSIVLPNRRNINSEDKMKIVEVLSSVECVG